MEKYKIQRKPKWMKSPMPSGKTYINVKDIVAKNKLHTICTSGKCPNMGECWNAGTATFMILGDICTRACGFCNTKTGKPLAVDLEEPQRLADSVAKMKIKHCVLTSVDRDDLEDGGAGVWAETIKAIKAKNHNVTIEALIPDFDGRTELIQMVIDAGAEVVSHNMETVRRLTPQTRTKAKYETSLAVIKYISESKARSKSGIMLGIGEQEQEVIETMNDLRAVGCQVMTIGQYLQPTPKHLPILDFIHPDKFKYYEEYGLEKGFLFVESGPLVRSSYHAEKHIA
ncbi:MAG: lipoyl synthase [Bacteroidetes bacterium]|nr:MAG: lipoyl synthase [Bacteroidota bacterium]